MNFKSWGRAVGIFFGATFLLATLNQLMGWLVAIGLVLFVLFWILKNQQNNRVKALLVAVLVLILLLWGKEYVNFVLGFFALFGQAAADLFSVGLFASVTVGGALLALMLNGRSKTDEAGFVGICTGLIALFGLVLLAVGWLNVVTVLLLMVFVPVGVIGLKISVGK